MQEGSDNFIMPQFYFKGGHFDDLHKSDKFLQPSDEYDDNTFQFNESPKDNSQLRFIKKEECSKTKTSQVDFRETYFPAKTKKEELPMNEDQDMTPQVELDIRTCYVFKRSALQDLTSYNLALQEAQHDLEHFEQSKGAKATDLDHMILALQSYRRFKVVQAQEFAKKAIMKYERGIRDLTEDFDEVEDILDSYQHQLIYNQEKQPRIDSDFEGTFYDKEDARMATKELISRFQEHDARSAHTSLQLCQTASTRVSYLWLY